MARLTMLAVALLLVTGCPLVHDDPAPTSCRGDEDCFTHEGEHCEIPQGEQVGTCKVRLDSGPAPLPDQRVVDLPITVPDAAGDLPDAAPAPDGDVGPDSIVDAKGGGQ